MKSFEPIVLAILVTFSIAIGQKRGTRISREATCNRQEKCILLMDCPYFLQKLRDRIPGTRKLIRDKYCGSVNFRVKLCCPSFSRPNRSGNKIDFPFPKECGNNPLAAKKITNGEETDMGELPWVVALGYTVEGRSFIYFSEVCAGSVINARYVLTAGHCVDLKSLMRLKLDRVRLGEWDMDTDPDCYESNLSQGEVCAPPHIDAKVDEVTIHPMYGKPSPWANDIALIRLDRTIDFRKTKGYILPICLPGSRVDPIFLMQGRDPIVSGWGRTEDHYYSNVLLKVAVPFANDSLCIDTFKSLFGHKQLCVGGTEKDSCIGDSGSPLMLASRNGPPYQQIGIVSFGSKICGRFGEPGVYTSVSEHKEWITENVRPW